MRLRETVTLSGEAGAAGPKISSHRTSQLPYHHPHRGRNPNDSKLIALKLIVLNR